MRPQFLVWGTLLLFAVHTPAAAGEASVETAYHAAVKVTRLTKTTTTSAGDPIVYPQIDEPEVTAVLVEIPPGAATGWHEHPVPCYAYILAGIVIVETKDGTKHSFSAGDAFAEMMNRLHNGKNPGPETVRLVMFVTGGKNKPFTVRPSATP